MQQKLKIALAQLNFTVGDISGNLTKIMDACQHAHAKLNADVIIFPELALTGYPPEDLLLRDDFNLQITHAMETLKHQVKNIDIVMSYPLRKGYYLYNAAEVIREGETIATYYKQCLPNYGVFDEKRYFNKGNQTCVVDFKGLPVGILVCEDLWYPEPAQLAKEAGAKMIFCMNASPFDIHKLKERERILKDRTAETNIPIAYVHCVGGQDEVVFDGRSMVVDEHGNIVQLSPVFKEDIALIVIEVDDTAKVIQAEKTELLSDSARAYKALMLGLNDYTKKNHFSGVLIGLSGGIDSALTLTIAVDALGKDKVHAVLMPSRYTSEISIEDAKSLANNLGIKLSTISIEPMFEAFLEALAPEFIGTEKDATEENIQARCRAIILMGLSNKFGNLLLTTGNKSEMAVGYATLYGDMAGGFAVLKDVYKTIVYELANYRNSLSAVIPQRIIDREPSAELAPDQVDQNTLPAYDVLDKIIEYYVEYDYSIKEIVEQGFPEETVGQVIKLIDRNEYKRRQAPPGVRLTTRAFGRDRRYPITSGFNPAG